jgi:UDP-glucuronate decarboxylase
MTAIRSQRRALPEDDPTQRQRDIALARRLLGWTLTTPLRDGLQKTIGYFESPVREGRA